MSTENLTRKNVLLAAFHAAQMTNDANALLQIANEVAGEETPEGSDLLRDVVASAYFKLRQVDYEGSGRDVFAQVAPIETVLGRIVEESA